MPSTFGKPIYCQDTTNQRDIKEITVQDIQRLHAGGMTNQEAPYQYAQYDKMNADTPTPTGVIEHWIRLYPVPSSVFTIALPHTLFAADMTADGDMPVIDCDDAIEYGATADAWRTKRQFAKAADFDKQFEDHIQKLIWTQVNQPNRITQFRPTVYDKVELY
jgi:hypothetical protein